MQKLLVFLLIVFIKFSIMSYHSNAESNFSGDKLKQSCIDYINKHLGDDVEIVISKLESQYFEESGIRAKCKTNPESLKGNCFVAIEFFNGKNLIRRIDVPVRIKIYKDVPVAKWNLQKNEIVSEEDLEYESKEVTNIKNKDVLSGREAVGKRVRRNVSKGTIITKGLLEDEELIHSGERVTLLVQSGNVTIRANGIAMQDAEVGSTIRVRREGTNSSLTGVVGEDRTVVITIN